MFDNKKLFAVPVAVSALAPVAVFAEGTSGTISDVTTGMTTGLTTIASDCMSALGQIVPVALPVMGAIVVISLGIKIFRKVTGR